MDLNFAIEISRRKYYFEKKLKSIFYETYVKLKVCRGVLENPFQKQSPRGVMLKR